MTPTTPPSVDAPPKRMRVLAGLAFVHWMRPVLYALLVASALLSFWAGSELRQSQMPAWIEAVAPILFGAFLLIFAVYRLALIRARHYPAATGLFQLGLGALVFVLLLPGPRRAISSRSHAQQAGSDDLLPLFESGDPRVRALAAEVAGTRAPGPRYVPALLERLDDSEPKVRAAARAALARLLAVELPAGESEELAAARLRQLLAQRGWLPPPP